MKKEKFNDPVTREELEPVFKQISTTMAELKEVVNTHGLLLAALTKILVNEKMMDSEKINSTMKEIHDSMQTAQKVIDTPEEEKN